MRECTIHIYALWKPETEIQLYLLLGWLFWIATTLMSSLTTQEMEDGGFLHKRITYIFGIRIEESHSNKKAMKKIEFFLDNDSSLTHLDTYKYFKD